MKYPLVLQHSKEDCGAACLVSIAKYYGRTFTLTRTREAVGTGQLGTSLLGLRRGAEMLGFYSRSASASPEILDRLQNIPLPAIIHWRGKHWTILYGKQGKKYIIGDPAVGIRHLSRRELTEYWQDWVILLLQPDTSRFLVQPEDEIDGIGRFLWRLLPYRSILLEALLCVSLIGLLSLVSPFFLQILTDDVLIQGNTGLLRGVILAVIVLYALRSGLSLVADNLIANFAQRLELELILEFGQQILRLPLTYYETRRSGEVVSRLRDIEEINRLVSDVVVNLLSAILMAIVSLLLMLFYSWKLALVAVFIAFVMTFSTIIFQPVLQQKTRRAMVLETETQGVLVEAFKGALTLKTTLAAPQFWDEIQSRFGRLANLMFKTTQISIINRTFSESIADFGNTALLGLGSFLVIRQELTIGQFLAFISLNRNVTGLMNEVVDIVDDYIRARTANARLQEIITATPETENDDRKPWVEISASAEISCSNLHFYYPGRVELLKDFSLTIPGGMVLIGAVGLALSLTALVKFNLTVKGLGIVRPDRELRLVQAQIDGKVSSIEVEVNEEIKQGAIIARLDRFAGETQQQQLQNNLQQTQIQIDRLNSQIQLLDTQILAEKNSLEREIAVAQIEIDRTQRDYRQQTTTLNANLAEAEAQLKLAKSEMERYQQLTNTGAISQLQLEEKQTAVSSAQAQITRTKAALNPSIASLEIAQARVTQQQAKSQAALASLSREREALQQGRCELQAQLLKEQKELQQIEQKLQDSAIRATSTGIIFQLNLRNRNQIVSAGDTIAQIAPSDNHPGIKTAIATEDIDKVKLGQLAQMRIDACSYSDYGILEGMVAEISPDAIIPATGDPNAPKLGLNSTEPYFEVTIQPKSNILRQGNFECQLKPGMRAGVNIITKQETLLKFILRKAKLLTHF